MTVKGSELPRGNLFFGLGETSLKPFSKTLIITNSKIDQ